LASLQFLFAAKKLKRKQDILFVLFVPFRGQLYPFLSLYTSMFSVADLTTDYSVLFG